MSLLAQRTLALATAVALPADRLRDGVIRLLGPLSRRLVVEKELRIAVVGAAVVVSSLALTLLAPMWL